MESGENWSVEFKLFPSAMALMAIVKVERVECKALDSIGFVYNFNLEFTPETAAETDMIVADMETGVIHDDLTRVLYIS